MIAVAAMNVPSVSRLSGDAKSVTVYRKYTYSAIATTAMLSSRRSSASAATRQQRARPRRRPGRGGGGAAGTGRRSPAAAQSPSWSCSGSGLDDLLVLRRALEARRVVEVDRGVV